MAGNVMVAMVWLSARFSSNRPPRAEARVRILSSPAPLPRVAGVAVLACVVSAAAATIWYGSLTHSTSNITQFVEAAEGQGLNLLPNSGANVVATYLQGESNQVATPTQYQSLIASTYRVNEAFIAPLPNAGQAQYALKPASSSSTPRRRPIVALVSSGCGWRPESSWGLAPSYCARRSRCR